MLHVLLFFDKLILTLTLSDQSETSHCAGSDENSSVNFYFLYRVNQKSSSGQATMRCGKKKFTQINAFTVF